MEEENQGESSSLAPVTSLLIMVGVMLGSGLGAAFGNVAIGIPAGMAVGGAAAMIVHALRCG